MNNIVTTFQNNTKEFLEAMYTTVALLSVEMAAIDESSFCLIDFIESIQTIAVQETGSLKLIYNCKLIRAVEPVL